VVKLILNIFYHFNIVVQTEQAINQAIGLWGRAVASAAADEQYTHLWDRLNVPWMRFNLQT